MGFVTHLQLELHIGSVILYCTDFFVAFCCQLLVSLCAVV